MPIMNFVRSIGGPSTQLPGGKLLAPTGGVAVGSPQ
jgi:hypothetical protein